MTGNSTKNRRIVTVVLRDARTDSLAIPKHQLYPLLPERQTATTKDEQL